MCEEHVDVETEVMDLDNTGQENRKEELDEETVEQAEGHEELLNDVVAAVCEVKDALADTVQKDEMIARLHERLAVFEEKREWREIQKPLFLDLIALVDALEEQAAIAASYVKWSKNLPRLSNCRRFIRWTHRNIQCLKDNLLDLLARHGVTQMPDPVGQEFDRTCQRAVNRVPTDSVDADRNVVKVVRNGYVSGEQEIVRYQEVWVESFNGKHATKEVE